MKFIHDTGGCKEAHGAGQHAFWDDPCELFQPKAVSSKLWRGVIFYHGGGASLGSLGKYFPCRMGEEGPHDRWCLSRISIRTPSGVGVGSQNKWKLVLLLGNRDGKIGAHVSRWVRSLHGNISYVSPCPGWDISV